MDRSRFIPDRLYLTDEAIGKNTTTNDFTRRWTSKGKQKPTSVTLKPDLDIPLTIVAQRLDDGRYRVTCIDTTLPSLLYGHNGRPIKTPEELALALTRLKHFVSLVVRPECRGRIIPGVGPDNLGYIQYAEPMIQLQDPGHRLLIGSHLARYRHQHKSPLVCWGQSTRTKRRELSLTFYDKAAQLRGTPHPASCKCTRLECIIRPAERIAKEVRTSKAYDGAPGEVVSTLTLATGYAVIRHNLSEMSGFGLCDSEILRNLSKPARTLIAGIGNQIGQRHAVDHALETFCRTETNHERTFRKINKEVRAYAVSHMIPDLSALVPESIGDLQWSDVALLGMESLFGHALARWKAPMEPDPQILEAWSKTTFLKKKPVGGELVGPLFAPVRSMPFRRANTL